MSSMRPDPAALTAPHPLRRARTPAPHPATANPYDALADMFLGEVVPEAPATPHPGRRAAPPAPRTEATVPVSIELLVLGHLPVLGSAWASQHARTLARSENRPVALLEHRDGRLAIEVAHPGVPPSPEHAPAPQTLDAALSAAASLARRWLIRCDGDDLPALLAHPGVDRIGLLTGGDEASVVAAYRVLKDLAAVRPHGPLPPVRVAVMGASPARADAVFAKLAAAVRKFLDHPLEQADGAPAIVSVHAAAHLFTGPFALATADLLPRIVRAGAAAARTPTTPSMPTPPPPPHTLPDPRHLAGATPAEQAPPPLATHIHGLRPLPFRAPDARSVELARDEAGRLHLLAHAQASHDHGPALAALTAAAGWTVRHAELIHLAAAAGGAGDADGLDAEAIPELHLFFTDPRAARPLLDAEVRLHLLARVEADRQTVWWSTDLN